MIWLVAGLDISPSFDPQSETPIYKQIAEWLKFAITSGRLSAGQRLPATRELAGQLGLNRATISAAYEHLMAEGFVSGHVGRGSFVSGPVAPSLERSIDWDRMLGLRGLEMPGAAEGDGIISFATSRPSEHLFPLQEFREAAEEVLRGPDAGHILQLGSPLGYGPLRKYLLAQARADGVVGKDDDIVITSGCQQALDLLARVLFPPRGEGAVAVENPIYPGLRRVLDRAGVRLLGVPVGEDGLDAGELERLLVREQPRMLVVTPDFQNPTGATMPAANREKVLALARRSGVVLVENNIYGALRYQGEPLPPLRALEGSDDTVLLGSFSKIAFPGLRVGWALGPRRLIARLTEAKLSCDLHTDQLSQAILLRFAASGRLERHHQRLVRAGAERLDRVLSACARHLPPGSTFTRPRGGMNLWVRLPEPLDTMGLLERARQEGVSYLPGRYFAVSSPEAGALRLSFAGLEPDQIEKGLAVLGKIFSQELAGARERELDQPAPAMV